MITFRVVDGLIVEAWEVRDETTTRRKSPT
jgi:hypothetical protein